MMEKPETPETLTEALKMLDSSETADELLCNPEVSGEDNGKRVTVKDASFGDIKDVSTVVDFKTGSTDGSGFEKGCLLRSNVDGNSEANSDVVDTVDVDKIGSRGFLVANTEESEGVGEYIATVDSAGKTDLSENGASLQVCRAEDISEHGDNGKLLSSEEKDPDAIVDGKGYDVSTGDVVWVKTKNQKWWPGKVCDPANVSEYAVENDSQDNLLIEYFGSSHVIWCNKSQLRPFHEYLEQLLAINKSRSFLGAVEQAVEEFGKCVKWEMTCSCISNECQKLGIGGVNSEEYRSGKCGELSVNHFKPVLFLSQLKNLAQIVSEPGMLERAIMLNHLSAFCGWLGHKQLPMDQLQVTIDAEDSQSNKIFDTKKSNVQGSDLNMEDSEHAKSSKSKKEVTKDLGVKRERENSEAEVSNRCGLFSTLEVKTREEACSIGNDSGAIDKGFNLRERKKSRYLSYPYVNWEHKGLHGETEDPRSPDISFKGISSFSSSSQITGSNSMFKSGCKKFLTNWYRKVVSEKNVPRNPAFKDASLAELLSELCSTAVDCTRPMHNMDFDLFQWFFSKFRVSAYQDESTYEIYSRDIMCKQEDAEAKPCFSEDDKQESVHPPKTAEAKKSKKMDSVKKPVPEIGDASLDVQRDLNSPLVQDSMKTDCQAMDLQSAQKTVKTVKKREQVKSSKHRTKSPSGLSDVNIGIATTKCLLKDCMANGSQTKEDAVATMPLKQNIVIPDLNNSNVLPSLLTEGPCIVGDLTCEGKSKSRKRKKKGASSDPSTTPTASIYRVGDGNTSKFGSLVIDLGLGPHSCDGSKKESCPTHLNSELTLAQSSVLENNSNPSVWMDSQNKSGGNGQRRKYKTLESPKIEVAAGIPDLNGTGCDTKSPGKEFLQNNWSSPQLKSAQKKNKGVAASKVPRSLVLTKETDVNAEQDRVGAAGQTKLHLQFGSGALLPSKEYLMTRFRSFGPMKESETHVSKDYSSAQIAFVKNADAEEAYRSLEKNNSFGASLVNYQLQYFSTAQPPVLGFVNTAKPSKSNISARDGPPIDFIRHNLQMMTSMLENSGNDISTAMRAKLEDEIKTLLKKVSSTSGSSQPGV